MKFLSRHTKTRSLVAGALTLAAVSCASGPNLEPGNPLPGVGLGAAGQSVLLSWAETGPLAQRMRPGNEVQLVASYPSDYGNIRNELLATARVQAGFQGIKFDLPDQLDQVPTGQVCMRMVQNRSAIPVRIPQYGESSDAFYYSEWSRNAELATRKKVAAYKIVMANENIARFEQRDEGFETWRQEMGLTSIDQCDQLKAGADIVRPKTAVEPKLRPTYARQQCVAEFRSAADYLNRETQGALDPDRSGHAGENFARAVAAEIPSGSDYAAKADTLLHDLKTYGPGNALLPTIWYGLPMDGATHDSIIANEGKLSPATARIVLEAYDACLVESQTRFAESLKAWQEAQSSTELEARAKPIRMDCRARFSVDNNRAERLQELLADRQKLQGELASLSNLPPTPLPAKKALVAASCPLSN